MLRDISGILIIFNLIINTRQNTIKYAIKMISRTIISSAVAMLLASTDKQAVSAKGSDLLYDHVSSDVAVYNKLNFEK